MENKTIGDYIILTSHDTEPLRTKVLEKIKEGYVPFGGVALAEDYGKTYAQAMIKYAKE